MITVRINEPTKQQFVKYMKTNHRELTDEMRNQFVDMFGPNLRVLCDYYSQHKSYGRQYEGNIISYSIDWRDATVKDEDIAIAKLIPTEANRLNMSLEDLLFAQKLLDTINLKVDGSNASDITFTYEARRDQCPYLFLSAVHLARENPLRSGKYCLYSNTAKTVLLAPDNYVLRLR
jgi:hypothetical protein